MEPTISELKSDWYIQFIEYFKGYIPRIRKPKVPHAYDVYLQKLDASRKRGRTEHKYLPLVPRVHTSDLITELSLKDSVIQKLNTRVYKLESVIQVLYSKYHDIYYMPYSYIKLIGWLSDILNLKFN